MFSNTELSILCHGLIFLVGWIENGASFGEDNRSLRQKQLNLDLYSRLLQHCFIAFILCFFFMGENFLQNQSIEIGRAHV